MENQNENQEPNYFVVFPTHLLDELSAKRCVLCGVLISLARKNGYAYIGNNSLSNIMRCSITGIQKDLQYLESHGYIRRDVIKNHKNEIVARRIYPMPILTRTHVSIEHTLVETLAHTSPQLLPSNSSNDINIKDSSKGYTDEFLDLWEKYGKVGNKKSAYKSWCRIPKKHHNRIKQHVPLYISNHEKNKKLKFVPHMSTYLNQERWEDELPYSDENRNLDINWD